MKNKYRNTDSSIKAGDLILTEQPFAFVLSSKEQGSRCDNCLQKVKVLKCSGCQYVHYCGRLCQKEAWGDHKDERGHHLRPHHRLPPGMIEVKRYKNIYREIYPEKDTRGGRHGNCTKVSYWECANFKRVAPKVLPDAARMLAKIINRLNRGDGHSYRAFYSGTSFRMWKDLMSHYSDLKKDFKRMEHFTSLCGVLYEFLNDISLPNTVELMGLYGRMVINSFMILDTDMNSIGTGIYLACSIMDHSCTPNTVATFDGKTIHVRALVDMPCLDWTQIRISYIDLMKTPYQRQTELLQSYYFLCNCDRCMDETQLKYVHAARCLNSECDAPVTIKWKDCQLVRKPDKIAEKIENGSTELNGDSENEIEAAFDGVRCNECGTKYTEKHIDTFIQTMEFTEAHLNNMEGASVAYVDVCKYCLDRHEGVLHPRNVMHAQTLEHAFDALLQVQLWDNAAECAHKLIPCFKFYYGDRNPLLGLLHLKYGKILLYKMDLAKALAQLKSSEKILKITHGDRHPLYREQLLPLLQQAIMESS